MDIASERTVVGIAEQLFDADTYPGTTCCPRLSQLLLFCLGFPASCSAKLLLITPLAVGSAVPPDVTFSVFRGGNGKFPLLLCFHPLQQFCFLPVSTYMLLFPCLLWLLPAEQRQILLKNTQKKPRVT